MKSLFRRHQVHILLVLPKKYIFSKHLKSSEDYPEELLKICLRFSLVVDNKTIDTNSHYILNIAGVPYSGVFGCLRRNQDGNSATKPL